MFTFTHTVGSGAQGSETVKEGKWFALWGLVPISEPDSKQMADGAENYTVTTTHTFGDQLISIFTNIVTISKTTVQVTK
jgi:hypothetical protein